MDREDLKALPLALAGGAQGVFSYYIRPEITAPRTWAVIASIVVAHELLCPEGELLSEGYDRLLERHRVAAVVGTLAITGHLLNVFKDEADPLHLGFQFMKSFGKSR
jgi:hypothetical protein